MHSFAGHLLLILKTSLDNYSAITVLHVYSSYREFYEENMVYSFNYTCEVKVDTVLERNSFLIILSVSTLCRKS